jgi:hypothetical protein
VNRTVIQSGLVGWKKLVIPPPREPFTSWLRIQVHRKRNCACQTATPSLFSFPFG